MLKEKALRTIKAEFKEYKQRILTNLMNIQMLKIGKIWKGGSKNVWRKKGT